jgi:hypothetical protein
MALDAVRCRWLRALSRTPRFARWFPHERRRLAVAGAGTFLLASGAATLSPVGFLLASTLVLGPLHLLSHVRFLPTFVVGDAAPPGTARAAAVTRRVGRYALAFAAASCATFVVFSFFPGATLLGVPVATALFRCAAATLASLAIARLARGGGMREATVGLGVAGLTWTCADSPAGFLLLTFLHNIVAFVHWIRASRDADMARLAQVSLTLILVAATAVLCVPLERLPFYGVLDALAREGAAWHDAFWRQTSHVPAKLGEFAPRLLAVFTVTQAMHYFVWLRAIPDARAARGAPRPLRSTWKALHDGVGTPFLAAWALATVVVVAWAMRDASPAKNAYLSLAFVHALVEIATARAKPASPMPTVQPAPPAISASFEGPAR